MFIISMAISGQTILQLSHLVQMDCSISCFSYGLKGIAKTGQSWEHLVHPVHLSLILYFIRSLHLFALQIPFVCSSYSSLKYLSPVRTGFGEVFPRPQRLPSFTDLHRFSSSSMSARIAFPSLSLVRILSICFVPILQKVHFPHDCLSWKCHRNYKH